MEGHNGCPQLRRSLLEAYSTQTHLEEARQSTHERVLPDGGDNDSNVTRRRSLRRRDGEDNEALLASMANEGLEEEEEGDADDDYPAASQEFLDEFGFAPLTRTPARATTTRRPIEGDCSICMLPLQEEGDGDSGNGSASSDGIWDLSFDDGQGSEYGGSNLDASSSASDDSEDNFGHWTVWGQNHPDGLVWCRGQCGNNFHQRCIDRWASMDTFECRPPTCPTCRAVWVDY